jgi:tRNA1(Val) A37 N6-methylase TrmN6
MWRTLNPPYNKAQFTEKMLRDHQRLFQSLKYSTIAPPMAELSPLRRLLKLVHPEGIPWPGSVLYNAISLSAIFQRHYELVANDILNYCRQGALLDIGTGPAHLLLRIHQQAHNLRLVGIDSSSAMVTKARQNIAAAGLDKVIEVKEGNADNIPFPDRKSVV